MKSPPGRISPQVQDCIELEVAIVARLEVAILVPVGVKQTSGHISWAPVDERLFPPAKLKYAEIR